MPEIKLKHVISFSSEDKLHRAENMLKAETYRKWKCASPGEKNASIVFQFEKATQINSIDIGNESSAFVEVLVGRSSDTVGSYKVLLMASSFMSPSESKNGINLNRVRMFGSDKLSQNLKDEKWDCVQVVCTQPFNKNISYGLSFIKFHSPPEKYPEKLPETVEAKGLRQLGAFKLKDEDESSPPLIGSWLERKNRHSGSLLSSSSQDSPSYAESILATRNTSPKPAIQTKPLKRKLEESETDSPSIKKEPLKQVSDMPKVSPTTTQNNLSLQKQSTSSKTANIHSPSSIKAKDAINSFRIPKKNDSQISPSTSKATKNGYTLGQKEKKPFHRILERVVFTLSGFVNPLRGQIRDKALEMGAKYKGDWDKSCTHLVCAFINTPKYSQVCKEKGRIVTKDWIFDCHKKKELLPWIKYMLGKYSVNSSEESDSSDDSPSIKRKPKVSPKKNGASRSEGQWTITSRTTNSPTGREEQSEDETEDEDAIQDYIADTDVDSDSGGDTEDEIRKVEKKAKGKVVQPIQKMRKGVIFDDVEEEETLPEMKPDTSLLPLPVLPDLFKKKFFFLYGEFSKKKRHYLERYISAYDGLLEDYMSDQVKYVVTESKWDTNFDEAVSENNDIIFVRPAWILKCHESGKFVPYQPYIVIPD